MTTKAKTETDNIPTTQAEINAVTNNGAENEIPESVIEHRAQTQAQKLKAIKYLSMPTAKSKDLCGVPFDIIDAYETRINDETSISFLLKMRDGKVLKVNKAKNIFTEAFLDYFESLASAGMPTDPIPDYTFEELTEGGKAGNRPITFRAIGV